MTRSAAQGCLHVCWLWICNFIVCVTDHNYSRCVWMMRFCSVSDRVRLFLFFFYPHVLFFVIYNNVTPPTSSSFNFSCTFIMWDHRDDLFHTGWTELLDPEVQLSVQRLQACDPPPPHPADIICSTSHPSRRSPSADLPSDRCLVNILYSWLVWNNHERDLQQGYVRNSVRWNQLIYFIC